ncbi:MAG: Cell division protein FtsA, partial [uncultured Microvirga sp.]
EFVESGSHAAPQAARIAQEHDAVGARCRHQQGCVPGRRAAAGREPRDAAQPHASRTDHRHRPSALDGPEGRRHRRSRRGRGRDPPGRPRGRADGQGRDPVGDREPDRRAPRLRAFRRAGQCARRLRDQRRRPRRARGRERPRSAARPRGPSRPAHGLLARSAGEHRRAGRHDRREARRRPSRRHRRHRGGAQSHAGRRALPSHHRGGDRHPLRGRALGARRRRGRNGGRGHRHGRRHDHGRRFFTRPSGPCRRPRGRRPSRHHGHRARALDPGRRSRAPEDAARLLHRHGLGRSRHDRRAPGRRGRARHSPPPAEVASRAHHQAAHRGDPRTRPRPAEERRLRRPGGPAGRADGRREPARRPAGRGAQNPERAGAHRAPARHQRSAGGRQGPGLLRRGRAPGLPAGGAYRAFRAAFRQLLRRDRNGRVFLTGRPLDPGEFL